MKKLLAMMLTLVVVLSMAAIPVLAYDGTTVLDEPVTLVMNNGNEISPQVAKNFPVFGPVTLKNGNTLPYEITPDAHHNLKLHIQVSGDPCYASFYGDGKFLRRIEIQPSSSIQYFDVVYNCSGGTFKAVFSSQGTSTITGTMNQTQYI